MTDTVGIRPAIGAVTVETGVAYYSYPGGSNKDPGYAELYVSPTYAVTPKLAVALNAYYAPDYYRMGIWENYNSITAKYDIGRGLSFSAELGHQIFSSTRATATSPGLALPDYTYGNVGFSYTHKSLTFDLRYHATTLSKQACFLITGTGSATAGSNGCNPAVIATLSSNTRPVRREISAGRLQMRQQSILSNAPPQSIAPCARHRERSEEDAMPLIAEDQIIKQLEVKDENDCRNDPRQNRNSA